MTCHGFTSLYLIFSKVVDHSQPLPSLMVVHRASRQSAISSPQLRFRSAPGRFLSFPGRHGLIPKACLVSEGGDLIGGGAARSRGSSPKSVVEDEAVGLDEVGRCGERPGPQMCLFFQSSSKPTRARPVGSVCGWLMKTCTAV